MAVRIKRNKVAVGNTKGKKYNISSYLLTINSNQTRENIPEDYFVDKVEAVLNNIKDFIIYQPGHEEGEKKIEKVEIEINEEVGERVKRLHVHATVRIIHRTMIKKIDLNMMEEMFKLIGLPGIYLEIQGYKDPAFYVEQYSTKGQEK
jgi:hypothetical protein